MITLKNTASCFLLNGDDILLMKRAMHRTLSPGQWASVGGHIEAHEFDKPETACLREIWEETGIAASDISGLTLRYIHMRRERDQIGLQYIFFARTTVRELIRTDEGDLFWIPKSELFDRVFPIGTEAILRSEFGPGRDDPRVQVMSRGPVVGMKEQTWKDMRFFALEEA